MSGDRLNLLRTRLANERTALAYLRTALGFLAAGVGSVGLMEERVYQVAGWALTGLAFVVLAAGVWRFFAARRSIDEAARPL